VSWESKGFETDYSLKTPAPLALPVYYRLLTAESTGKAMIIGFNLANHTFDPFFFFLSIVSNSP